MNKLTNEFNRGFSLKNDDLRFIDYSIRLALADIASGFSEGQACILWGCNTDLDVEVLTVSEGAIMWEGEVWHVGAHSISLPVPEIAYWCFRTSNDPAGVKIDKDLISHQAYEVRDCVVQIADGGVGIIGSMPVQDTPRASDYFSEKGSSGVTYNYGAAAAAGSSVLATRANGICTLTGSILADVSGSSHDFVHLPSGYFPKSTVSGYLAVRINGSDPSVMPVQISYEIHTDGNVLLRAADSGGQFVIHLGSISFLLD